MSCFKLVVSCRTIKTSRIRDRNYGWLVPEKMSIFSACTHEETPVQGNSRVDTDVLMEVAYSCNFLDVSDSSTCPDPGTS